MAEPETTGESVRNQASNIVRLRDAAIKAALQRYACALAMPAGREQTHARFAALLQLLEARCR